MSCIISKAFAIPLTSVPNLASINVCFNMGGGNLECSGLTETQLLGHPGSVQPLPFPDHFVTGGISDQMGNISPVGEYFVLTIGSTPGVIDSLNSVFLSFVGGRTESPFEVTSADVVLFHGLTLTDPNQLLNGGDLTGTIVFGFRSAVPEPASLGLMGIGLTILVWRCRAYRASRF
jgi:hypothetical protein